MGAQSPIQFAFPSPNNAGADKVPSRTVFGGRDSIHDAAALEKDLGFVKIHHADAALKGKRNEKNTVAYDSYF